MTASDIIPPVPNTMYFDGSWGWDKRQGLWKAPL